MNALSICLLDHRDSFAFLLGDQFAARGADLRVVRCPGSAAAVHAAAAGADLVVLSPGPGRPEDFASLAWLRQRPAVPVLGVCLGHQAIVVAAGGRVEGAPRPVHGRASRVDLADDPLFADLGRSTRVARYHSLVATVVPSCLQVIATTAADGLAMAVRHRELPQLGLQFHPESMLTPDGGVLIDRVLAWAGALRRAPEPASGVAP